MTPAACVQADYLEMPSKGCPQCGGVSAIAAWRRGVFQKYCAGSNVEVSGWLRGCFGIENYDGRSKNWWITHVPTGKCFGYSAWASLKTAKAFCDGMLALGYWEKADKQSKKFNAACESVAVGLGFEKRGGMKHVG